MMLPTTAFLAVSLFKPELEGEWLAQHVRLLNEDPRFTKIIIGLGDTLHAYNIDPEDGDLSSRVELARAFGDRWITMALPFLKELTKPWTIMRHEDQVFLKHFKQVRSWVEIAFASEPFMSALDADVMAFVARAGARKPTDWLVASSTYILEELSADIALSQVLPFSHIYPGKPLESYLAVLANAALLPTEAQGLEHCAFLRTRLKGGRIRYAGEPITGLSSQN